MTEPSSVRFARTAQTDLLELWCYVADDSLASADRLLDLIEADAQKLAPHPLMGRARPELGAGIRCWPTAYSYSLYYLADDEGVIVIRVLHQARDLRAADFPV